MYWKSRDPEAISESDLSETDPIFLPLRPYAANLLKDKKKLSENNFSLIFTYLLVI